MNTRPGIYRTYRAALSWLGKALMGGTVLWAVLAGTAAALWPTACALV